jgi:hypothetical protein|eukprot:Transcript_4690.p1 GENE.Transcript_4690~~Transcript_4690.p1  ORF type:complete len:224 (+),score=40.29 Transcript_4690:49-720(+)
MTRRLAVLATMATCAGCLRLPPPPPFNAAMAGCGATAALSALLVSSPCFADNAPWEYSELLGVCCAHRNTSLAAPDSRVSALVLTGQVREHTVDRLLFSPLGDEAIATDTRGGKHLVRLVRPFPTDESPLDFNLAMVGQQPGAGSVIVEVFTPPNRLIEELKRGAPLLAVVLPAWLYFGWRRLRETFLEPSIEQDIFSEDERPTSGEWWRFVVQRPDDESKRD